MTDSEKWAALRAPFAPEQVQHRPGGGGSLAYVSHGLVTDRLLHVDPGYMFTPLMDDDRRPIVVLEGLAPGDNVGVWGMLEILGAQVVEFCSGKDLMDAYSRCLCRCAMRRGVALDLWSGDVPRGEVRKEGGLGDAPVPKTWAQLNDFYKKYGDRLLHSEFVKAASYHLYGNTDSKALTKEERQVLLQKAAGATVWLAENGENAVGPLPPSVELYTRAWAHVLGGHVLEGIEWTPPPGDPDAETIGEEVFQG